MKQVANAACANKKTAVPKRTAEVFLNLVSKVSVYISFRIRLKT